VLVGGKGPAREEANGVLRMSGPSRQLTSGKVKAVPRTVVQWGRVLDWRWVPLWALLWEQCLE
jgi:hypothetical protein